MVGFWYFQRSEVHELFIAIRRALLKGMSAKWGFRQLIEYLVVEIVFRT